jgi:hypothetical protein
MNLPNYGEMKCVHPFPTHLDVSPCDVVPINVPSASNLLKPSHLHIFMLESFKDGDIIVDKLGGCSDMLPPFPSLPFVFASSSLARREKKNM